jgi:hypothetical protein
MSPSDEAPSNEPPSNEPMSSGGLVVLVLFGLIVGPIYTVQGLETEGWRGIGIALCGLLFTVMCVGAAWHEIWSRRR